jgi:hypothetical protein
MMSRSKKPTFSITLRRGAVESIFDECDKHDADETGGRLLGTYHHQRSHYDIEVKGVLEPGPNAQRSPTYFLQDGNHQEKLFRAIEARHPEIEHLGNWHTHHVNGYPTLSPGDKDTYFRTVNHAKHNTDFFYALLVTSKSRGGNPRYTIKHFVFRRGDDAIYEIPESAVRLVEAPPLRPGKIAEQPDPVRDDLPGGANPERGKDHEFFADFYPGLKALFAKDIGAPYWKGPLSLVDGSRADIVAMEDPDDQTRSYSIASSFKNPLVADVLTQYKQRKFRSARHAVLHLERDLNQTLYRGKKA